MTAELPVELREARVLRLQPDDVVLLTACNTASDNELATLLAQGKRLFPDRRVVAITRVELMVVRPEVADRIEEGRTS